MKRLKLGSFDRAIKGHQRLMALHQWINGLASSRAIDFEQLCPEAERVHVRVRAGKFAA